MLTGLPPAFGIVGLVLHLVAFFVAAMVCHGELVQRRPAAADLTEFYVWMSVGGVLGGIFNALLAPMIFSGVYEYPVALILAGLLQVHRVGKKPWRFTRYDAIVTAAVVLLLAVLTVGGWRLAGC